MADTMHPEQPPTGIDTSGHVSRFATCSVPGCGQAGVRGASCATCRMHLCARHQARRFHRCPSASELDDEAWEKAINDEVSNLLSQLNHQALVQVTSSLRGGKPCVFMPGQHLGSGAIMGCANYHAWLIFDDGERWLARIPRTGFSDVPPELVEYLVCSEYATLKFLETTSIPAPKAFGYGLASDPTNHVGVSYLLIEALPGRPYQPWNATPEQSRHVLNQVADMMIELSRHPFPKAGSLLFVDDEIQIDRVASNRFIHLGCYGPFTTTADYFGETAAQYISLILDGQLHHRYPLEAYLFYSLLQSHAADMPGASSEAFFLKHVDDKGDHLLIDDDYNVVGVIDWQFARTVPACEAFGPSLLTADLNGLYSRESTINPNDKALAEALRERGSDTLAAHMSEGDLVRRFQFGIPGGMSQAEVREVLAGVLISVGAHPITIDVGSWIETKREELAKTSTGKELLQRIEELLKLQDW